MLLFTVTVNSNLLSAGAADFICSSGHGFCWHGIMSEGIIPALISVCEADSFQRKSCASPQRGHASWLAWYNVGRHYTRADFRLRSRQL